MSGDRLRQAVLGSEEVDRPCLSKVIDPDRGFRLNIGCEAVETIGVAGQQCQPQDNTESGGRKFDLSRSLRTDHQSLILNDLGRLLCGFEDVRLYSDGACSFHITGTVIEEQGALGHAT